jgi:uncharacterized membrane protein YjjB (DUF3815 family)
MTGMLLQILYSTLATIGFGVVFNIRGRELVYAGLNGGLGWAVFLAVQAASGSDIFSTFVAALAAGALSEIMAVALKKPATLFIVCAIVPLVPGALLYQTMYEAMAGNYADALNLIVRTLFIAGAIAAGIALSTSLSHLRGRRHKVLSR